MRGRPVGRLKSIPGPNFTHIGTAGFTVAEIILALGIASILLVAMVSLFVSINRSYTAQNVAADVQQVTRVGIDMIARNIRLAGLNPLQVANAGIVTALDDKLRLTYDADGNGTIESDEDITFLEEGGSLKRKTRDADPYPVLDNVTKLSFTYFDAANAQTNRTDAIRTIEVFLTVEEPAGRGQKVSRTYSTRVIGRNLGFQ